jgi:ribosome-associated translation inhibitor RaiA
MRVPLQMTFRNAQPSPAIEAIIREQTEKLEKFYGRMTSCRVVIDTPHRHQRKGKLYRVQVELNVPHSKLVITRHPSDELSHSNLYVAIRDAFDTARRRLQNYVELKIS